jgi:Transposase IS66 family
MKAFIRIPGFMSCWKRSVNAHARRTFDEALKTLGRKHPGKGGRATKGLVCIQMLYRIERLVKDASPQERYCYRNEHARLPLEEIRQWLDAALPEVPLPYTVSYWLRLSSPLFASIPSSATR